jgi:hypothetical protein
MIAVAGPKQKLLINRNAHKSDYGACANLAAITKVCHRQDRGAAGWWNGATRCWTLHLAREARSAIDRLPDWR